MICNQFIYNPEGARTQFCKRLTTGYTYGIRFIVPVVYHLRPAFFNFIRRQSLPLTVINVNQAWMNLNRKIKIPGNNPGSPDCTRQRAGVYRSRLPFSGDATSCKFGLSEAGFIQRHVGASTESFNTIPFSLPVPNQYDERHLFTLLMLIEEI